MLLLEYPYVVDIQVNNTLSSDIFLLWNSLCASLNYRTSSPGHNDIGKFLLKPGSHSIQLEFVSCEWIEVQSLASVVSLSACRESLTCPLLLDEATSKLVDARPQRTTDNRIEELSVEIIISEGGKFS